MRKNRYESVGETSRSSGPNSFMRSNACKTLLFSTILVGILVNILYFTNLHDTARVGNVNLSSPLIKVTKPLEYASSLAPTTPHRPDLIRTHWAVITTIFKVNPAVKHFNRDFPDFGLVVVGDRKTKHDPWKAYSADHPNVVYLSPGDQLTLGLTSALHIPWDHFGRKSMGYLYAMQHGAESIYDFDDDNQLTVNSFENTILSGMEPMLVDIKHHLFNPYPHYGPITDVDGKDAYVWPRGFPLQFIHDPATRDIKLNKAPDTTKIAIYQSLADHNPDVDAIYRMTRKVPVTFKSNKDQLLLPPQGTFVPWNAQAVLANQPGFFGLLLPTTVTGRVSDIWRSYILTRLLWETEQRIAFTPPIVTQYRNPHSYQKDLEDEADLYYRCDELLAYLAQWTRPDSMTSMREAYLDIMAGLVERQFLTEADDQLVKAWVNDLDGMSYTWPKLTRHQPPFVPPTPPIVDERATSNDSLTPVKDTTSTSRDIPDITEPWKKPSDYCYKGGNDWSACAGDHLPYYPTKPASNLLNRSLMCIHEPFCWKQLDWEHTDPPEWTCPSPEKGKKNLLFWDMSFHDCTMGSAAPMIEKSLNKFASASHRVELCNSKGAGPARRNYPFDYKECPRVEEGTDYLDGGGKVGWLGDYTDAVSNRYKASFGKDPHFRDDVSALIFGFSPSMFEFWTDMNMTLVLALWHVADKNRCTTKSSQRLFDKMRDLARDTKFPHIIGGNTFYHSEYIRYYTGINPILLPVTLLDALSGLPDRWAQSRPEFLWNSDTRVAQPTFNDSFKLVQPSHEGGYTMADLTKYAGVVVHPYSITNGKLVEQYALEIPMFAPTPEFSETMLTDRTAVYAPYCPGMRSNQHPPKHADCPYDYNPNVRIDMDGEKVADDVKFWASFSEIYHWPCIKYYGSYDDLFDLLVTSDRKAMSACMKQANKWRQFEELQAWCWASNYIQKHT